jgi:hypothetical protein
MVRTPSAVGPHPYDPGVRRRIFPANEPIVTPWVVALDQPNGRLLLAGRGHKGRSFFVVVSAPAKMKGFGMLKTDPRHGSPVVRLLRDGPEFGSLPPHVLRVLAWAYRYSGPEYPTPTRDEIMAAMTSLATRAK